VKMVNLENQGGFVATVPVHGIPPKNPLSTLALSAEAMR
jgi:hypothetical protein